MAAFHRITITTPDDDFLDVDVLAAGHKRAVLLCHGLEGSSQSQYIHGNARLLSSQNWDILAMNYRFCSGRINKQLTLYHSGATYDLDTVIQYFLPQYDEIVLVGFSLGGNLVLKYCGERGTSLNPKVRKAVAISVPVQLAAGARQIAKKSNLIYSWNFLKTLKSKLRQKQQQYPDAIDVDEIDKVRTIFEFDDTFTGPLHGFENAMDYYTQNSSLQYLNSIQIPTLIINALNDPFLPEECYPYEAASQNEHLSLITPQYGGHVGFGGRENHYWSEKCIAEFLNCNSNANLS